MIPYWKLMRELDRVGQTVLSKISILWEPLQQRSYDRRRQDLVRVNDGVLSLRSKIAIFLIFQPGDIAASTLRTCRYLAQLGYSPLVVSNAPLADAAMRNLRDVAWKVIQRPNFGYDFGGYRDAVLFLKAEKADPDRLLILNDSIWFPLRNEETLLARLEASGLDMAGPIVRRATGDGKRARRVFVESYLMSFSAKAWRSPAFLKFWQQYRMSSNKFSTVRRGEARLADAMIAGGLTAGGIAGREEFLEALAQQDDAFLRRTLQYVVVSSLDLRALRHELLLEDGSRSDWRTRLLDFVAQVSRKRNFHNSFPFASMSLFDLGFLKKTDGRILRGLHENVFGKMREIYFAAVASGDLPTPAPDVIAEARARGNRVV